MVSVNNIEKNLRVQACLWHADISSIECMHGSGVAGSCGFTLNRKDNFERAGETAQQLRSSTAPAEG